MAGAKVAEARRASKRAPRPLGAPGLRRDWSEPHMLRFARVEGQRGAQARGSPVLATGKKSAVPGSTSRILAEWGREFCAASESPTTLEGFLFIPFLQMRQRRRLTRISWMTLPGFSVPGGISRAMSPSEVSSSVQRASFRGRSQRGPQSSPWMRSSSLHCSSSCTAGGQHSESGSSRGSLSLAVAGQLVLCDLRGCHGRCSSPRCSMAQPPPASSTFRCGWNGRKTRRELCAGNHFEAGVKGQ